MPSDPADLRRNARRLLKQSGWWHLLTRRNALYLAALATGILQFVFLFMYLSSSGGDNPDGGGRGGVAMAKGGGGGGSGGGGGAVPEMAGLHFSPRSFAVKAPYGDTHPYGPCNQSHTPGSGFNPRRAYLVRSKTPTDAGRHGPRTQSDTPRERAQPCAVETRPHKKAAKGKGGKDGDTDGDLQDFWEKHFKERAHVVGARGCTG
jgi:hypothetical protein